MSNGLVLQLNNRLFCRPTTGSHTNVETLSYSDILKSNQFYSVLTPKGFTPIKFEQLASSPQQDFVEIKYSINGDRPLTAIFSTDTPIFDFNKQCYIQAKHLTTDNAIEALASVDMRCCGKFTLNRALATIHSVKHFDTPLSSYVMVLNTEVLDSVYLDQLRISLLFNIEATQVHPHG